MNKNIEGGHYLRSQEGSVRENFSIGLISVGVIFGALAFNSKIDDMLEKNLADKLSRPQGAQMEQVDNKCEGDIFTIGDMKIRIPRTEQFRRFEVPRENPAK